LGANEASVYIGYVLFFCRFTAEGQADEEVVMAFLGRDEHVENVFFGGAVASKTQLLPALFVDILWRFIACVELQTPGGAALSFP